MPSELRAGRRGVAGHTEVMKSEEGNTIERGGEFRFARDRINVGSRREEPDDLGYWLARPPAERLAGIEFLRRQFYAYGEARREFRRLLEIT